MSYRILPISGTVISRSTVYLLSDNNKVNDKIQERLKDLDKAISERIGNYSNSSQNSYLEDIDLDNIYASLFEDDDCDNDNIQFQEVDQEGKPLTTPYAEDFIVNDNQLAMQGDITLLHSSKMFLDMFLL